MGVRNPNSTGYVHPDEPNLLNLHKAMEYDGAGKPVVRVEVKGLSFDGNVDVTNVEISNDVGNPIPVSKNTTVNSSSNPIFVSGVSGGSMGDFPAASVTAFEEPFAVTITPVIQADMVYGLDPDVWAINEINNGTVTTSESVWAVASGTSTDGYARLYTRNYLTYRPGQGAMGRWTAAFTVSSGTGTNSIGVTNAQQTAGLYGPEDGFAVGFSGDAVNNKFGVLHRRAGKVEIRTLTITQRNTGAQTATVTLDDTAYTISLDTSASTSYCAHQIAHKLNLIANCRNRWQVDACDSTVTISYFTAGPRNGTFSFSSSGTGTPADGTFARTKAGVAATDVWHYIDTWDTVPQNFDPSKLNVYAVDFRWLGAGRVRFFMEDPLSGKFILIHTITWTSQYLEPHIIVPSLRLNYRSGPTNGTTPAQNAIVRGASVFAGIQGEVKYTRPSQGISNLDSTTRSQNTVHHLISLQNPYIRGGKLNVSNLLMQTLTVATQNNDPCIIHLVRNAVGTSDLLLFNPVASANPNFNFAQVAVNAVTETLSSDEEANVQTVAINGSATFDLQSYNFRLSPGDTLSVFIISTNSITRSGVGLTWTIE